MKEISNLFFQNNIQILPRTFIVGILATVSLVSSSVIFGLKADAQSPVVVNSTEVTGYAQAVLAMEPIRQQSFGEIKKIIGNRDIPKIVCNDPNSMNSLPNKARDVAVNYCSRSQKIVEENGLSIARFNTITIEIQNNKNLERQVYNAMIRIQKASVSQ